MLGKTFNTFFRISRLIQSDQKENKSRALPHLLFYRNVCLTLTRTQNYTYYAQSFNWLLIYPVSNVTF
jgi:hypothetical protein